MNASKWTVLVLWLTFAPVAASAQTTWYVDAAGVPPGSGTPGDPYTSVQHAIAQPSTVNGDTVLVAPGTYDEWIDFLGKGIVVESSGGAAVTILRGDPAADPPRSVVRFASGEPLTSVLRGFTVREGNGTLVNGERRGGGILIDGASPRLFELVIEDNAAQRGGGIFAANGDLYLSGCILRHNRASSSGGALHLSQVFSIATDWVTATDCSLVGNWTEAGPGGGVFIERGGALGFVHCEFRENRALGTHPGGALYAHDTYFGVSDSSFVGNQAAMGGAAHVSFTVCASFSRCLFLENEARSLSANSLGGGAIRSTDSCVYVRSSRFERNRAEAGVVASNMFGGAIAAWSTNLFVDRSVFHANRTDRDGGAIYFSSFPGGPDARLDRVTLVSNSAVFGGAVWAFGPIKMESSIVWDTGPSALSLNSGGSVTWSDVQGGFPGTGNIDADPRFWDALAGDFHLKPDSPCIDTGDPTSTDPDGSRADMGAHPFDAGHCPEPVVYCTAKLASAGCLPEIGFQGWPALSGPDDFFVLANAIVNQQPGMLFWGRAPAALPFSGGTLCAAAPFVRTPPQSSGGNPLPPDCSGSFSFHFSHAYIAFRGLVPGDTLYAQHWFRDPAHPDGTGIGLGDALRFSICP